MSVNRPDAPGSPNALRQANRRLVLEALTGRALSQADLARATGLSPATVSNLVRELSRDGRLTVTDAVIAGKRVHRVGLAPRDDLAVGVALTAGSLTAALIGEDGSVRTDASAGWNGHTDLETSAEALATVVEGLFSRVPHGDGGARDRLTGIGIAVPGWVDIDADLALGGTDGVPRWAGPATAALGKRLGCPVHVENDGNLGAVAELVWGAGRGHHHVAYVGLATHVCGGIIAGGRLFRGAYGGAGEIGHTTVDERGPLCQCGSRGCLELYAGGAAILDLLQHRDADGNPLTIDGVARLARDGDPRCRRALADAGRTLGVALGNVTHLVSPALIVLGGPLVDPEGPLIEQVRHTMIQSNVPQPYADRLAPPIVAGELGTRASLLGAAVLGLRGSSILRGTRLTP